MKMTALLWRGVIKNLSASRSLIHLACCWYGTLLQPHWKALPWKGAKFDFNPFSVDSTFIRGPTSWEQHQRPHIRGPISSVQHLLQSEILLSSVIDFLQKAWTKHVSFVQSLSGSSWSIDITSAVKYVHHTSSGSQDWISEKWMSPDHNMQIGTLLFVDWELLW